MSWLEDWPTKEVEDIPITKVIIQEAPQLLVPTLAIPDLTALDPDLLKEHQRNAKKRKRQ